MPIPFDMIAVMLFLGYYAETPAPHPPAPGVSLAVVAACGLALAAAAFAINRAALALLRRRRAAADRRQVALAAELLLRTLLVAVYAYALAESALPWSLAGALGWRPASESFFVQMAGILPYILFFPAAWLPMYGLHAATNFGTWNRWTFILHKARYNLYLLLAWIPFALLADWLSGFLVLLPAIFLAAAWAFPLALARAWGCVPLAEGPVMDMVRELESRAGVRFSRVYLWEPGGGGVQNAAAVGVFPPFRYLFLTPALIRNMTGDELRGVILHELGHVKNRHLLFYLFTSLAGLNLAVLAGALAPLIGPGERFLVTAALVLVYFRVVFGWLSRIMERQADLFALEQSGSARGLANALEKLALGAGNIRLAHSWHHLGVAERVDFLRRAERQPELAGRHHQAVSGLMRWGYLASAAVICLMITAAYAEYRAGYGSPASAGANPANRAESHWRRVMAVLPDNAGPRLELAYLLAGRSDSRSEAARLAAQALDLSEGGQTGAAARKLIRDLEHLFQEEEGLMRP